jgi:hypothetical protein
MPHPFVFKFFFLCPWVYALIFFWGWGTWLTPLCLIFVFDVIEFRFTYFSESEAHAPPFMFSFSFMSLMLCSHLFVRVRHMPHPFVFDFFFMSFSLCPYIYALIILWGWGTCLTPLCLVFVLDVIEFKLSYFSEGEAHGSPPCV